MQTNKAGRTITAILLALTVIAPASLALLISYSLSGNQAISSTLFFGTFLADLIGAFCWMSRHTLPAGRNARLSIHQFIAHMKMHPELLPPGMTEFDLERFRKLHSKEICSGETRHLARAVQRSSEERTAIQPASLKRGTGAEIECCPL